MVEVELRGWQAMRVLHPRPAVIVISRSEEGRVNGCAVSWVTPVNVDPPVIALALAYSRLTYEYVKESGEATINVLPADAYDAVHYVGRVSGRDVPDKLVKAGFQLVPSRAVSTPHIDGAAAYIEAVLRDELKYPDHAILTFEALRVVANSRYFKTVFKEDNPVLLHAGGDTYVVRYEYVKASQPG